MELKQDLSPRADVPLWVFKSDRCLCDEDIPPEPASEHRLWWNVSLQNWENSAPVQSAQSRLLCDCFSCTWETNKRLSGLFKDKKKNTIFSTNSCNKHSKQQNNIWNRWIHSLKVLPFVEEVESSCQAYEQQDHAENSGDCVLLHHRLSDQLQVAAAGAVEAQLTPGRQEMVELQQHTHTHTHTQRCTRMRTCSGAHWGPPAACTVRYSGSSSQTCRRSLVSNASPHGGAIPVL